MENAAAHELYALCEKFILDHKISCPEVIQSDRIMEDATPFIETICNVVGYYVDPLNEEDA